MQGRFIHVAPLEPTTTWNDSFGQPWWSDKRYQVRLNSHGSVTCIQPWILLASNA